MKVRTFSTLVAGLVFLLMLTLAARGLEVRAAQGSYAGLWYDNSLGRSPIIAFTASFTVSLPLVAKDSRPLVVTSSAFAEEGTIPVQYSCDGADVSPPLAWTAPPSGTQSFALIMDDPDAPGGTWVHWVLFNVPAATTSLPENVGIPAGARQGRNTWGNLGYGGPCPPIGTTHRYFFKLYALNTTLALAEGATKQEVEAAMTGHVLGQAQLMGRYGS